MIGFFKTLHRGALGLFRLLIPYSVRARIDAETFGIVNFMEFASKKIKPSDIILDAGAGQCPYRKYFSHALYESTDWEEMDDKFSKNKHAFICSLDKIPRPDNSYDAIINTQVLEHVEYPQKVINEFYRILRPGGKLFLTAPQGWGIHGAPYNFFNFTIYGLESLFRNAGFKIIFIKPRGGMFWYLGNRIKTVPDYIFFQYAAEKNENASKIGQKILAFVLFPFYIASVPICILIPLLFFYLDKLDQKQDYTLGYACYCVKEIAPLNNSI
jgi:SAM-dependent methyltransferase